MGITSQCSEVDYEKNICILSEAVVTNMADSGLLPAICFNLVVPPPTDEHNLEYGRKLRELAEQLGFPPEYGILLNERKF